MRAALSATATGNTNGEAPSQAVKRARDELAERVEELAEVGPPSRGGGPVDGARQQQERVAARRAVRCAEREVAVRVVGAAGPGEAGLERAERRRPAREPGAVADEQGAPEAAGGHRPRARRRTHDERRPVGQPVRLVEARDGEVAERAERPPVGRGQPGLRRVLEQEQAALVAPAPPSRGVLREAEVVHEIQRPRPGRQQRVELVRVRLERRRAPVPARREPGADEGLDLRAVVIGGDEDLVAGPEPEREDARVQAMAAAREEMARRVGEREGRVGRRAPSEQARRQRRADGEQTGHRRAIAFARLASGRPYENADHCAMPVAERGNASSRRRSRRRPVHSSFHGSSAPRNS
jgi:hypothetical protein